MKNTQQIQVIKRNGSTETLDINKIHRIVEFACKDLSGVSVSELEIKSQLKFYNNIKTNDIHETLIKAAGELISEETPNYQYVAGRLINFSLRKAVYGSPTPIELYDHVKNVCAEGFYTKELLEWYTEEEFKKMNSFIDHSRDDTFSYSAMEQFRGKYLVKNRVTGKFYETPQMLYILIGATLFNAYPKETRMKWIKDFYDLTSTHVISLPTPIMSGVRTPQKQFSSCVVIETGDDLESITSASAALVKYVSRKAGIGLNVGRIRAKGSPIRNGDSYHTGIFNFLKYFQASVKSCNQGGVRGGAATFSYPIWHLEFEDLIVLKNNKGNDDNRIRNIDYSVQLSKLFYERYLTNGDITLFSPSDVPGLMDAFYADQDKFKELYEKAEKNTKIRKTKLKARDVFNSIMTERKETGRIYIQNVDNANIHSSFLPEIAPITMSNLCQEIDIPTRQMGSENELIGLCTLAAINWGKISNTQDFEKPCETIVRALDALLEYQNYPVAAAKRHTDWYRTLGVGITNFAYWMAKNGLSYEGNQETYDKVDEYAEAWSYYLIKASAKIAKEKGSCEKLDHTKYSKGILPIDTYKKETLDKIVSREMTMPWGQLREELKETGIRNATLMALMPCETSSVILNSTNGIEPPRAFVSYKESKDGSLPQLVPDYSKLKNKYELLWNIKSPEGYLTISAILQKYIDQGISVNTSYNPEIYPDNMIPMSKLIGDLLLAYKLGHKQLYYLNTQAGQKEEEIADVSPVSSKTKEETSSDCASCTL